MQVAIISDVHSNYEALKSVLADIRRRVVQQVVCLGDLVGYNCFPSETLALFRESGIACVHGNHDLMAINELEPVQCGPHARKAILWTRDVLSEEEKDFLRGLPPVFLLEPDMLCIHSCLGDPVGRLMRPEQFYAQHLALERFDQRLRICFTGHTHVQEVVEIRAQREVVRSTQRTQQLNDTSFYFVNPGSVGHPRGSDYRAAYAIYDSAAKTIEFCRVPYNWKAVMTQNAGHQIYTDLGDPAALYSSKRIFSTLKSMVRSQMRGSGEQ
jgi:predicted phosphodiesterase